MSYLIFYLLIKKKRSKNQKNLYSQQIVHLVDQKQLKNIISQPKKLMQLEDVQVKDLNVRKLLLKK